ncbi:MAG: hypothetical protein R3F39_22190 [Myxococcota bacterium]
MRSLPAAAVAALLVVASSTAHAAVLKHHDFVSGTLAVADQLDTRTGEYYAVRFEADSYPVTITELRFFLGDNGTGKTNGDCSSWNVAVWEDPLGDNEPGSLIFDSADSGQVLELFETVALQSVALSSFNAGPIVANGPFRIALQPEDKQCWTQDLFGSFAGIGRIYSDAAVTPGVNFVRRRLCQLGADCIAHPELLKVWVPLEEIFPAAGDFIMEVVTPGGGPAACSPPDCDDADACTTDWCVAGKCQHVPISGCGVPDPVPDSAPDAAPDSAVESAPDAAPDVAAETSPDLTPEIAPDSAPTEDIGPVLDTSDAAADATPPTGALRIDRISPGAGDNHVTTAVVLEGAGFVPGMSARIGPHALQTVGVQTPTRAIAVVPAGITPRVYTLYVRLGDVEVSLADAFEVREAASSGCAGGTPPNGLVIWLALALLGCALTRRRARGAVAAALVVAAAAPLAATPARAHGIQGHMHVTGWALENQPAGELRDFFDDPEVMDAALFGAAFTDSGYWPQAGAIKDRARAYSEHTHWEPFIEDFIQWIRANDPPPWTSLSSRKRVAFLMGCASHGQQDEIFDSLFLFQVNAHDKHEQESADPGTDGFLALDEHLRFLPPTWMPLETLLELYKVVGDDITAEVVESSVGLLELFYLGEQALEIATSLGHQYKDVIPWTRDHYLDPDIPGSLLSEIPPTLAYQQAIWQRLHGELSADALVVGRYPEPPRRILGVIPGTPDSWVTLVFGLGMKVTEASVSLQGADGMPLPFELKSTRWGGPGGWSRVMRLLPTAGLEPGGWYTATVAPGVALIDGSTLKAPIVFEFQAPCDEVSAALCPDLGELVLPNIDGPPPVVEPDPGPEPVADAGPEPVGEVGAELGTEVAEAPDSADAAAEADAGADAAVEPAPAGATTGGGGCAGGGDGPFGPALTFMAATAATLLPRRRSAS